MIYYNNETYSLVKVANDTLDDFNVMKNRAKIVRTRCLMNVRPSGTNGLKLTTLRDVKNSNTCF